MPPTLHRIQPWMRSTGPTAVSPPVPIPNAITTIFFDVAPRYTNAAITSPSVFIGTAYIFERGPSTNVEIREAWELTAVLEGETVWVHVHITRTTYREPEDCCECVNYMQ
jgi:hypothetical protein